jgi:hypothetical protein
LIPEQTDGHPNICFSAQNGWNLEFLKLLQSSVCHVNKQFRHTDFSTFFGPYKGVFPKNKLSKTPLSPFFMVQTEFTFSFDPRPLTSGLIHAKLNQKQVFS